MQNHDASRHPVLAFLTWIGSTVIMTATFWLLFGACVDMEPPPIEPPARVVASWDPLQCGDDDHRVVVELEDDDGAEVSGSVPCKIGGLTLDVRHWGVYRGRIYAWTLGPEIRSVTSVRLDIDSPILWWTVDTPR